MKFTILPPVSLLVDDLRNEIAHLFVPPRPVMGYIISPKITQGANALLLEDTLKVSERAHAVLLPYTIVGGLVGAIGSVLS
jgi:hypothetical protein